MHGKRHGLARSREVRRHIGAKPAPAATGNGLRDEHEPLDRSHTSKPKRRQADRDNPTVANKKTERVLATRRDEPVTCAACGRRVQRRMRGQRYCSARCREKNRGRVRKAFLGHDTRAPTTPIKKYSSINGLEDVQTGASTGIPAPAALRGGRYDINDLTWDRITLCQRRGGRVMATIEPDSTWPSMWRVRMPDGHLTDLVNLTRAKDAAQSLALAVLNQFKNPQRASARGSRGRLSEMKTRTDKRETGNNK